MQFHERWCHMQPWMLCRGERVVIDFDGVELATQSFIHALISDPIRQFGEDAIRK